jgi:type II secretory pathway component PulC
LPAGYSPSNSHAEQLFGSALPVSTSVVPVVMPNVRLIGVFAGVHGFAVFELDGKRQLGLAIGHEIVAGAKLLEVAKDHVVIERAGVRQQILLVRGKLKNSELKQNIALK